VHSIGCNDCNFGLKLKLVKDSKNCTNFFYLLFITTIIAMIFQIWCISSSHLVCRNNSSWFILLFSLCWLTHLYLHFESYYFYILRFIAGLFRNSVLPTSPFAFVCKTSYYFFSFKMKCLHGGPCKTCNSGLKHCLVKGSK